MTDELFLSSIGGVSEHSLMHVLQEMHNTGALEPNFTQHSSYHDLDQFNEAAKIHSLYFSILTTNIESLNAKFDELFIHITELNKINFKYSVICLQETWLSDNDDISMFRIDGYNCISQGKSCGNKGGLMIYVDDRLNFEITLNLNKYKHWEGLVIKIKDDNLPNPFVIFNLYRPPRSTIPIMREFFDEISPILNCIDSPNHNIILAGDTNINL